MPLYLIREDITRMQVDAIVAAGSAKPGTPRPTGGVNGSIHRKAGEGLLAALRSLGGVRTGGATLTKGYDLPAKYVIHTAGPVWQGGGAGEAKQLRSCYEEALRTAARHHCRSIAFPLISTGLYGYPRAEALEIATRTIRRFLETREMTVYLVVYDKEAFRISGEMFRHVEAFIDQQYVDAHASARSRREEWAELYGDSQVYGDAMASSAAEAGPIDWQDALFDDGEPVISGISYDDGIESGELLEYDGDPFAPFEDESRELAAAAPLQQAGESCAPVCSDEGDVPDELARRLRRLDEGFADMLLRKIDEIGIKDSVCYRRANVDRKLFNKIKNSPGYTPKKSTVAAFCIALELPLDEAVDMLAKAGYGMSRASVFDVVLEYFISRGMYDVDRINRVLFDYDMPLLGSDMK